MRLDHNDLEIVKVTSKVNSNLENSWHCLLIVRFRWDKTKALYELKENVYGSVTEPKLDYAFNKLSLMNQWAKENRISVCIVSKDNFDSETDAEYFVCKDVDTYYNAKRLCEILNKNAGSSGRYHYIADDRHKLYRFEP